MDKIEMTPEQMLAFDGFIDVMVQIYKMTSDNYNLAKSEKSRSPETPKEKEKAIIEAFRHFQMV